MEPLDSLLFGDQNVVHLLGAGANGVVFRSYENTAIKIAFLDPNSDLKRLQKKEDRVRREYEAVAGKHHKNVISMFFCDNVSFTVEQMDRIITGCGQSLASHPHAEKVLRHSRDVATRHKKIRAIWFEMELCGPTLRAWLNWVHQLIANSSSEVKKIEKFKMYEISKTQAIIARGILDGLKFLHGNGTGILHRDLKPENIMFSWSTKGRFQLPIKIGDFGLCRKLSVDQNNNPLHLSDENLSDSSNSSQLSQLYQAPGTRSTNYQTHSELHSLGLVLYELLQPMKVAELRAKFDKLAVDQDDSDLKEHFVLDGVKELISRLTSKDLERRPINIRDINLNSRAKIATSSKQLSNYLLNAAEGELIQVASGEYWGTFEIKTHGVILEGGIGGGKTIIRCTKLPRDSKTPAFLISGDKCLLKDITLEVHGAEGWGNSIEYLGVSIKGKENTLYKVIVKLAMKSVQIIGNNNVLEECKFLHSVNGITVKGRDNRLNQIKLKYISWFGIDISGDNNKIMDIDCSRVRHGIKLDNGSKRNFIKKFTYIKSSTIEDNVKVVWVRNGENNTIERLHCGGLRASLEDWGLLTDRQSNSTQVFESSCGAVSSQGKGDSFRSVDFGQNFIRNGANVEDCVLKGIAYR